MNIITDMNFVYYSLAVYFAAGILYRGIKYTSRIVSKAKFAKALKEHVVKTNNSRVPPSEVEVINLSGKKIYNFYKSNPPSQGISEDGWTFYAYGQKIYIRRFYEAYNEGRLDEELKSLLPEFYFWEELAVLFVWPIALILTDLWDLIKIVFEAPVKAAEKIISSYAKLLWEAFLPSTNARKAPPKEAALIAAELEINEDLRNNLLDFGIRVILKSEEKNS